MELHQYHLDHAQTESPRLPQQQKARPKSAAAGLLSRSLDSRGGSKSSPSLALGAHALELDGNGNIVPAGQNSLH